MEASLAKSTSENNLAVTIYKGFNMTSQGNMVVNWTNVILECIKYRIYRGDRGAILPLSRALLTLEHCTISGTHGKGEGESH